MGQATHPGCLMGQAAVVAHLMLLGVWMPHRLLGLELLPLLGATTVERWREVQLMAGMQGMTRLLVVGGGSVP